MPSAVVLGKSLCNPGDFEYDSAEFIGYKLAEAGFDIVTGGYDGIMVAALKGAANYNVKRIGIMNKENPKTMNNYVTEPIWADSYLDRLKLLIEKGDAYVILSGETGTLLEFSAVWALSERKIIKSKYIATLGEQWYEMLQVLSFYSIRLIDTSAEIRQFQKPEDLVTDLIKFFK